MVGPQSSALVSLGAGCSVSLTANSDATISMVDGGLCLSVAESLPAGETDSATGTGSFSPPAPEYLFLGAGVGVAAIGVLVFDETQPVSK